MGDQKTSLNVDIGGFIYFICIVVGTAHRSIGRRVIHKLSERRRL